VLWANALDGAVMAACMDRHRHREWLKFVRRVDGEGRVAGEFGGGEEILRHHGLWPSWQVRRAMPERCELQAAGHTP